jgi:hypothetical protein
LSEVLDNQTNIKRPRLTNVASKLFYTTLDRNDNPFLEQIRDDELLKKLFYNFPFIPYNGTNQNPQHTLLYVLDVLSKISPTQSAVLNSMSFYCFGGKVSVVESVDTEFSLKRNELDGTQAEQYYESLKLIKPRLGFRGLGKLLFRSRKACGEHYIRINYFQLAGVKDVKIHYVDPLNIMPVIHKKGEPETFITYEDFTIYTLTEKKYDVVGKYPYITQNDDGSFSTIIQHKNGIGTRGRPDQTGILIDSFREYKDNIFLTRQSANNFTPQVFIEQEEADPEQTINLENESVMEGFKGLSDRLRYNYTNNGDDPETIMWSNRPFGTSASLIHEFTQKSSEKWFVATGSITEKRIIKAYSWSERLMDDANVSSKGGFSSNPMLESLQLKLPLIDAETSIEEHTINTAIDSAFNWLGIDFEGYDIKFNNPYRTIIDSLSQVNTPQPAQKADPNALPKLPNDPNKTE